MSAAELDIDGIVCDPDEVSGWLNHAFSGTPESNSQQSRSIGSGDHDIALAAYEEKKRQREREEQWRRKRGLPSLDHPTPNAPVRREATGESFPQELWDLTWEDYGCSQDLKRELDNYLDHVRPVISAGNGYSHGIGLLLGGHSLGAGKSAAAVLVAKEIVQCGADVRYITYEALLNRGKELDAARRELEAARGSYDPYTEFMGNPEQDQPAKDRYDALRAQEDRLEKIPFLVIDGIRPPWTEAQQRLADLQFVDLQRCRTLTWSNWTIAVSNMTEDEVWDYFPRLWAELGPDQLYIEVSPDDASKHAIQPVPRNDVATPA
jgi:hypothetical protein